MSDANVDEKQTIGDLIESAMARQGLTQAKLAERVRSVTGGKSKLCQSTVSQILRGRTPSLYNLWAIGVALGVDFPVGPSISMGDEEAA